MIEVEVDGVIYRQQPVKGWPVCPNCVHDAHGLPCAVGVCDCGHPVVRGTE
jgi:hypothetical protein